MCCASFHFALGWTRASNSVWLPLKTTIGVALVAAIFPSVQVKVVREHLAKEWGHAGTALVWRILIHEEHCNLRIVHGRESYHHVWYRLGMPVSAVPVLAQISIVPTWICAVPRSGDKVQSLLDDVKRVGADSKRILDDRNCFSLRLRDRIH